ncbi:hypothetical protein ACFT5C_32140 [Streptomyces sp. NPDC057116]
MAGDGGSGARRVDFGTTMVFGAVYAGALFRSSRVSAGRSAWRRCSWAR